MQDPRPAERRRWSPHPGGWGRLPPKGRKANLTKQTCCLLIPALLPAPCWGPILEGSARLITQHGSCLSYPAWEQRISEVSAGDPGYWHGPGHLHLCTPEASWHPALPGMDPQHTRTRSPLRKPECLLLYFPKSLNCWFLIHPDREKNAVWVVL